MHLDTYILVQSVYIAHYGKIIARARLRSVTCHMGSHSVICLHPTQVNAPLLDPRQITTERWKAELTLVAGYNTKIVYLYVQTDARSIVL